MARSRPVVDREGYDAILARVAAVFRPEARFPDMVFKSPAQPALFCEFEALLGADLWPALCDLARLHGDESVDLLVIDPDGDSYYVPNYKMYPAVSLKVSASADDYWDAISEEPSGDPTGAIVFSAEVVAVTGASGKWGCWGERAIGVAVIHGIPDGAESIGWLNRFGPFLVVSDALEHYIAPNFGRSGIPADFKSTLTAIYRE